MKMRIPKSLYFFQNGANPLFEDTSILDGQGHVTAIHLASGQVSELHIPPPGARELEDIVKRNLLPCLLNGIFALRSAYGDCKYCRHKDDARRGCSRRGVKTILTGHA